VKLSTIVAPEDIEAFYTRYAEVCKTGMTGLKKRDRKKGKAKAKGGALKTAAKA
jgi:signal recognition particle subunit SRP14